MAETMSPASEIQEKPEPTGPAGVKRKPPTPEELHDQEYIRNAKKWARLQKEWTAADSAASKAREKADELGSQLQGVGYQLIQQLDKPKRLIRTEHGTVCIDRSDIELVDLEG